VGFQLTLSSSAGYPKVSVSRRGYCFRVFLSLATYISVSAAIVESISLSCTRIVSYRLWLNLLAMHSNSLTYLPPKLSCRGTRCGHVKVKQVDRLVLLRRGNSKRPAYCWQITGIFKPKLRNFLIAAFSSISAAQSCPRADNYKASFLRGAANHTEREPPKNAPRNVFISGGLPGIMRAKAAGAPTSSRPVSLSRQC